LSREIQAWELRIGGFTFAAIGEQLGITEEGARQAYLRGFNRQDAMQSTTLAEEKRAMLHRNDVLRRHPYTRAQKGDEDATKICMQLDRDRARLLGLSNPFKIDIKERMTEGDLQALDQELLRLNARVHGLVESEEESAD